MSVPLVTEERLSATIGDGLDNRKNFLMDECRGIGGMHWRELGGITEGAAGRDLSGHQLGHFAGEETEAGRVSGSGLQSPLASFLPSFTHSSASAQFTSDRCRPQSLQNCFFHWLLGLDLEGR